MKILAVDDEKIALEGLISAIREVEPSAEIWGFRKVSQVLEFYSKQVCDVAFLDIQMRTMSGIELAKRLKLITPQVNIIFCHRIWRLQGRCIRDACQRIPDEADHP